MTKRRTTNPNLKNKTFIEQNYLKKQRYDNNETENVTENDLKRNKYDSKETQSYYKQNEKYSVVIGQPLRDVPPL